MFLLVSRSSDWGGNYWWTNKNWIFILLYIHLSKKNSEHASWFYIVTPLEHLIWSQIISFDSVTNQVISFDSRSGVRAVCARAPATEETQAQSVEAVTDKLSDIWTLSRPH